MRFMLLLIATIAVINPARAFHDKGAADCSMCHTMHNSENGMPVNPTPDNNYLLVVSSATDLCLSCHQSDNGSVWAQNPVNPAPQLGSGNFIFGGAPNINDSPNGNLVPLTGSHGIHNCVAPSRNSGPDPVHMAAPGGAYPSSELSCTSCHDPHGNENYRMLRGVGNVPAGNFNFMYPAPEAEGLTLSGQAESITLHTAYKSGWSNWCANCHGYYHEHAQDLFEHPVNDAIEGEYRLAYERYAGSGNPIGGNAFESYIPELPFEDVSMTTTTSSGPTPLSRIACITCHRAHGSSATDLGRWDFRELNIRQDGHISGSYPLPSPYITQASERQLCVKCHEPQVRQHGLTKACIECHRFGTLSEPGGPIDQFKKP
ncbi:MAG: hypothetical protein IPP40_08995 [bacterium]|nr:hypothetical protein [bacterium]